MQLVMCDNDTRMVKCGEGKRADYLYLGALVMILLSLVCLDLGFFGFFFFWIETLDVSFTPRGRSRRDH